MRLLVDSHALIWEVLDDPRLSKPAQDLWDDPANVLLVSPASLWEIGIKVGNGKLELFRPLEEFFETGIARNGLVVLPIDSQHAARVSTLPFYHRDRFDRMIVAQALCEGVAVLSADKQLDAYGATRLW